MVVEPEAENTLLSLSKNITTVGDDEVSFLSPTGDELATRRRRYRFLRDDCLLPAQHLIADI